MMIIFKNFFSFVLTFFAFDWVTTGMGIKWTIVIIASIQVVIFLTSIPMCKCASLLWPCATPQSANRGRLDIYGKRIRAWSFKHNPVQRLAVMYAPFSRWFDSTITPRINHLYNQSSA